MALARTFDCKDVARKIRSVCARLLRQNDEEVEETVPRLATAAEQLHFTEGRLDTASAAGRQACHALLSAVDGAAQSLRAPIEVRKYRDDFTINYRALFPDACARHYRVDIFEAALLWSGTRWVNGERFDLSEEALHAAENLQCAWAALSACLSTWRGTSPEAPQITEPVRHDLRAALASFDVAWTVFERKYISELIHIEASARGLVMRAVEAESKLAALEEAQQSAAGGNGVEAGGEEELREARQQLLACVSRLNSAANLRWKGRDDRGAEVLEAAVRTLKRGGAKLPNTAAADAGSLERNVASVLAKGVVEAFEQVRSYLREVPKWIDSVHPHLCNNAGLVARVSSWTESWELSARYMEPEPLLQAVCDLVHSIHEVRQLVPGLASMCQDVDAELFLVLPRIVWLWFLAEPSGRMDLLRRLVPHHFDAEYAPPAPDRQLLAFIDSFKSVCGLIAGYASPRTINLDEQWEQGAQMGPATDTLKAAWEVMVTRVVAGPSGNPDVSPVSSAASRSMAAAGGVQPPLPDHADADVAVEAFVHELERWSMELQRHCPEDWCQCSAVLVRCLIGPEAAQAPSSPLSAGKVPFCV